jgi:hypothetical protein
VYKRQYGPYVTRAASNKDIHAAESSLASENQQWEILLTICFCI